MTTTLSGHRVVPEAALPPGPRDLVVPLGLGMVLLQLAHRGWALANGFFYTDDYRLLLTAHAEGLSGSYLMEPFNSHVMPGTRFLAWVVEASGPLNWGLALTITLILQAAASLACLWMLIAAFGRRWFVLAPFGLFLTSAVTAQATLWWISSLNQISIQAMFCIAVGCWVHYLRSARLRWLAATGLAVTVGLLFFQKVLLVLPVLLFLAIVYFAKGSPPRRVLFLVRHYWPAALFLGVIAGTYTAYSLAMVDQPFTKEGNALDAVRLSGHMANAAVVGALGGPWRWEWHQGGSFADPPVIATAVCATIVLAIAGYAVLTRRRSGWAVLLLVCYFGMLVGLVATSRVPVFGASIGLAYRFQTDLVCVLALCLGLAFVPVDGAHQSSEPRERIPGPAALERAADVTVKSSWLAAGVGLVCLSGVICWTTFTFDWHKHVNQGRDYLETLDHDLRRAGTTALADRSVPGTVLPPAFFTQDQRRISGLVALMGRSARFPAATAELAIVSRRGEVHRALIDRAARNRPGPHQNCGWLGMPPQLRVPLTGRTIDLDWWVRIGYLSTAADDVSVTAGDQTRRARISEGLGNLYVKASGEFASVVIGDISPGTRICVDTVEVGTLVEGPRL